jgi:hypothetical protein
MKGANQFKIPNTKTQIPNTKSNPKSQIKNQNSKFKLQSLARKIISKLIIQKEGNIELIS